MCRDDFMLMKRLFIFLWLSVSLTSASLQAQESARDAPLDVVVRRVNQADQPRFEIQASAFIPASPQLIWSVLTDYDRMHEFVPNLLSSRLVSRDGQEAVVEQKGRSGWLFIQKDVRIVARVTEHPFSELDIALVSGEMKHYSARWTLTPAEQESVAGTRIVYTGTMEPDFAVSFLVTDAFVQADVKKMLTAVIAEITRRSLLP
jgi:ribosome-associated toxin RatA of RatAB toxin-antitoxin module